MTDRIFLESVGKPYSTTALGHARAWEVHHLSNDPALPPLMYIMESEIGNRFLLGREVSGRLKFNMIRYIAKSFVDLFLEQIKNQDVAQYLFLKNAYPFDLQDAVAAAAPFDLLLLPTVFIRVHRIPNQDGTDRDIQFQDPIGEYRGDTWLIPIPVIASGLTVASLLRTGFKHHRPKRVYLLTACGSTQGIRRIFGECRKAEVELIPVFSQCIFEVGAAGNLPGRSLPSLTVIHPGSIATESFYKEAAERYQGMPMCCIGNLEDSLNHPVQYTMDTLWEMQVLGMDPTKENWSNWTVNVREENFQKKMLEFNPGVFNYFMETWKKGPSR